MAELEPEFQVRVWRYTYADGNGGGTILLNSPQESPDKRHDTLVLRQVNSDAENKVWIQEQASQFFERTIQPSDEPLMDNAHAVIIRDGHGKTIPKPGEKAATHGYSRGDRVWIDRSLVPTHDIQKDGNKIPVIDLETFRVFEIPFQYVCFIPQFIRKDESGEQHAAAVGPVLNTFQGKRKTKARIYFRWPADKPDQISFVWLNKKDKADVKEMKAFVKIEDAGKVQEVFRKQWQAVTKTFAERGLLFGDEIISGTENLLDSSSESDEEEDDLAISWKTGSTEKKNCCNVNPCPAFNNPDLDLVASYIGGYRWMEHYHVQDDDYEECPRGAEHQGHCVLRDNRTRCAYSTDRVRHTCCKLRMNPLLPGPHGDPHDTTLSLWETTAGKEYFVDASRNVRTRAELEDRDEIPPEMERLRQQILAGKMVEQQVTSFGSIDVQMMDAFPSQGESFMNGSSQTQGSAPSSQQTLGDSDTMITAATSSTGFSMDQNFPQTFGQSFAPPIVDPSLYPLNIQPADGLQFAAPMGLSAPYNMSISYPGQLSDPGDGAYPENPPENIQF